ncbi:transposase [Streptomyces griseoruber]|uniref:Transposase IS4-like domain-containing protein n=1 Tax=Streptomyces griseoruber TaxID=1943 RepID=A0A117R7H6_9ACTN|nr:hypothetical protein AQJ64_42720 [Streptomyces griseoruber]
MRRRAGSITPAAKERRRAARVRQTVKAPPALVRVIEYHVDGQADIVRLIASLTDHEKYPAEELAVLHAWRWEIELVFDEIKTTNAAGRSSGRRHRTACGRRSDAHLIVHHVTRDLLDEGARLHQPWAWRTASAMSPSRAVSSCKCGPCW